MDSGNKTGTLGNGLESVEDEKTRLKAENARLRQALAESEKARRTLTEALTHWLSFGSWMTRSCVVDNIVPRRPELQELYTWFDERQVAKSGDSSCTTTVPREGDEAKLLEIAMPLLDQASALHNAMHERCLDLENIEAYLQGIARKLVGVAQRIFTQRDDDRKALIETRDAAMILALSTASRAAQLARRTPVSDEEIGQALVATFTESRVLLRDAIQYKHDEAQMLMCCLPNLVKNMLRDFLAES